MSQPRVSVVIGVHNGERYLAAAIESALAQRPLPFEVVVVDDGSTDTSPEVARRFGPPVRCVSQARRGIGGGRNGGVAASSGDYLAFLDSDDVWTPLALASQLAAFAAGPGLDLVFGHVRQFISPDVEEATALRLACRPEAEPGYLAGAVLIRRGAFEQIGDFREDVTTGDFLDWMARARDHGLREALVDEQVLWRRIHESNHSLRHADGRSDYARVVKWALDRRRAGGGKSPGAEPS